MTLLRTSWHHVRATHLASIVRLAQVAHARAITHLLGGQPHIRAAAIGDDEAVARLAGRQHGIVFRRQLRDLGLSPRSIDFRIRVGRLRWLSPGVYAAGHDALTYQSRALAAVGSAGGGCATSHTALVLRGIDAMRNPIFVCAPHAHPPRKGVVFRRSPVPGDEITVVDGIPTATAARALLDLSGRCSAVHLRRFFKQAEFERELTVASVSLILRRYPRRPGRRDLAALLASLTNGSLRSRSELEDRFHAFLAKRGLPLPETNVVVAAGRRRFEVDCLWRRHGLVVELDGAQSHATSTGFEDDRARDRALVSAGLRVIRVTWTQLLRTPEQLEVDLRLALSLDARAIADP